MKTLLNSVRMLLVLTVLTGLLYPLAITGVAQLFFPAKANGSFVQVNGAKVGSSLIGQNFGSDRYFWPRPSAVGYNPMPSGGSNFGPTSAALRDSIAARAAKLGVPVGMAPADLLTASGSGLDPDISPEAANFQIDRIVKVRGLNSSDKARLEALIVSHTLAPQIQLFGEPRVNVLKLNLALDSLLH